MVDAKCWVPEVLRDAGEDKDDNGVYVVGVLESLDPESWSQCYDAEDKQESRWGCTLTAWS
jgi:hypothetical protein